MNDQSLAGRKALVTGGARGIGAEIATALAKAGASVMIGDILLDLARETAGGIAKLGVTAGATKLDVTDDNQWEQAVAATISTLGGFDILINNAGIEITSLVVDIKAEDVLRMCNVNVVGTALGMKHAFRAMRPSGDGGQGRRGRQHLLGRRDHRVPRDRRLFRHQIRGRSHDPGRRDGIRQARIRRSRQLHLPRPDSDRNGHAARQRHREGRPRRPTSTPRSPASSSRPRSAGSPKSPTSATRRCSSVPTRRVSSPASVCRSMAAWACEGDHR